MIRNLAVCLTALLIPACSQDHHAEVQRMPDSIADINYGNGHPLARNAAQDAGLEQAHVDAVNAWRASQGLPAFQRCSALDAIARAYSEHESIESFFAHQDPEGDYLAGRCLLASGIQMVASCENLFVGFDPSPSNVLTLFLGSPGHLANLQQTTANTLGVGTYYDGTYTFVTYEFIWR